MWGVGCGLLPSYGAFGSDALDQVASGNASTFQPPGTAEPQDLHVVRLTGLTPGTRCAMPPPGPRPRLGCHKGRRRRNSARRRGLPSNPFNPPARPPAESRRAHSTLTRRAGWGLCVRARVCQVLVRRWERDRRVGLERGAGFCHRACVWFVGRLAAAPLVKKKTALAAWSFSLNLFSFSGPTGGVLCAC